MRPTSIFDMKILLIDDSESSTLLLEAILRKEQFTQLFTAHTFSDALTILEAHSIDLILLSYILPERSGLEVCRSISSDLRYEDIPIIMVTANNDIQTLKSSFQHGANDYIHKPIKSIELIARVQSHLIRKQINDERKIKAYTDSLTLLYNRRYFDTIFEYEYTKTETEKGTLAFFMLDIDNFKKYNDTYGHQKGDETLKAVALACKNSLHRVNDYLFRIGGEEFVIILRDPEHEFLKQLSARIHESIKALNIEHTLNEDLGRVSVSIGIAHIKNIEKTTKYEIYNSADKALYQAKEQGRNQSCFSLI